MEGELTFRPYLSTLKQATLEKTRTKANRLSSINLEEVAALVIDNGYVSPTRLNTKGHNSRNFGLRSRAREQSLSSQRWTLILAFMADHLQLRNVQGRFRR